MARALVDTGAVVALINRADRHHTAAAEWFQRFRGQLLTTEAVVTETAYVLAASQSHQGAALIWFERARAAGLLTVEPVAGYAALARIIAQYANLPCDYADASLIALAERSGVTAIRHYRPAGFLDIPGARPQALSRAGVISKRTGASHNAAKDSAIVTGSSFTAFARGARFGKSLRHQVNTRLA